MTSCCHRRRMRWSGATGAIARCKNTSTGYARRCRSVPAWHWICGVKPKPKAVNKRSPHSIRHGLGKPGVFTTVSIEEKLRALKAMKQSLMQLVEECSGQGEITDCPILAALDTEGKV